MYGWLRNNGPFGLFLASIVFVVWLGGSVMTLAEIFPSNYVRDAYRAGVALKDKAESTQNPYASNLWFPARTSRQGVTTHDPTRAYDGLTLYTSGRDAAAYLIDMDGRAVHRWQRPFSSVWDESAAARNPVPDDFVYFEKAVPLPNGDLLAVYVGVGDTPWGYGLVKLDRDSNVTWKNLDAFHHDIALADDGRIYGLTHSFRRRPLASPAGDLAAPSHLEPPILEDYLVILGPDGRTQKRISLLEAVNRSVLRHLLWRTLYHSLEDPLHTNDVDILDRTSAARLRSKVPVAAEGQVLLSFRDLGGGAIALLDVDSEQIVWGSIGSWVSQHDPDILANGNILMFDNLGHLGLEGLSRVLEVDPRTGGMVWTYAGTADRKLESTIRSAQQRLPNGNTLITESDGGRLLEVTPQGDIVWEFLEPVRAGENDEFIPIVNWARRLEPGYFRPGFGGSASDEADATISVQ